MVRELHDDLTKQILIRLPVKSIFRFKCVSKTWNCFLSSPYFRRNYCSFRNKNASPLLGFFQFPISVARTDAEAAPTNDHNRSEEQELVEKVSFLPICEQGLHISCHDFMKKLGFFYACSSGFVVCGHHPTTYYVCNPVTNQWVSLPLLNNRRSRPGEEVHYAVGIYCKEKEKDEEIRLSYKVVRAHFKLHCRSKTVRIAMYSSKTGVWRRFIVAAACYFELVPKVVCTTIKGAFFWLARPLYFAVYNPKKAKHRILLISYPPPVALKAPTLGESADGLIQCVVDDVTPGFKIFVLKMELGSYCYSNRLVHEWVWRHTVSVDIPGMIWDNRIHSRAIIPHFFHPNQPRRLALHPQNSLILYLRVGPSFFSCDLATGTSNLVPHGGNLFPCDADAGNKLFPYFQLEWPLSPLTQ